jgi:hypothetical protein
VERIRNGIVHSAEMQENFERSLEEHKRTPSVDLDTYRRNRRWKYGEHLLSKKRVYLDTNHWVGLCEVHLGRSQQRDHLALHECLVALVTQGKIICPVSYPCITEMFKQEDLTTRQATAQVIDQLSLGSAIQNPYELMKQEILDFISTKGLERLPNSDVPLRQKVWTRVAYFLGDFTMTSEAFTDDIKLAVQKAFEDLFWDFSLEALVMSVAGKGKIPHLEEADVIQRLNRKKLKHAGKLHAFDDAFLQEIWAMCDTLEGLETLIRHRVRHNPKIAVALPCRPSDARVCASLV